MERERIRTLSEVAHHRSKEDCWIIIHGEVVDVTKFMEDHPGGEESLMEYAGKDATKAFEDIGHSKAAQVMLSKLKVGCLQGYSKKKEFDDHQSQKLEVPKAKQMEAYVIKGGTELKFRTHIEFFVPLVMAGLYFGYWCASGAVQLGYLMMETEAGDGLCQCCTG